MSQKSYSALIQFPHDSFRSIISAVDEFGHVNVLQRHSDHYAADVSFSDVVTAVQLFADQNATLIKLSDSIPSPKSTVTAPKAKISVAKYQPRGKKRRIINRLRKDSSKNDILRKYLTGSAWRSMADIEKLTEQKQSSIHARFTAFRSQGLLEQKKGSDGKQVYRMKKSA